MKTTTLSPSKRKIINLDETTFKTLSIMAIEEGTKLKNYIEKLLADIADSYEDSRLYAKLSTERPEGHVILNQLNASNPQPLATMSNGRFIC